MIKMTKTAHGFVLTADEPITIEVGAFPIELTSIEGDDTQLAIRSPHTDPTFQVIHDEFPSYEMTAFVYEGILDEDDEDTEPVMFFSSLGDVSIENWDEE
jgi:hypothetical protein